MRKGSRSWSVMLFVLLTACMVPAAVLAAPATTRPAVAVETAVNINTATVEQLMTLDGIGRKVAEKIVEYRKANGLFQKPEEVRRVQGIGAGLWERNRERIVVK